VREHPIREVVMIASIRAKVDSHFHAFGSFLLIENRSKRQDVLVVSNSKKFITQKYPFSTYSDNCSQISRRPPLNRRPGKNFAVLLHNFALVVDQDQRVVGILCRVFLVLFLRLKKQR